MEYRKLGSSDLSVSRIGFGCWAIGGHGYGRSNDRDSLNTIRQALDAGINFFDTADVYGFGHSEEILSKGLGPARNEVVIATKFGVTWDDSGRTYYDCSPQRLEKAIEGSLRRLKVDCIPLYQIHWYDNVTPLHSTLALLLRYQEQGKIKHIGCSNFSLSLLVDVSKEFRFETVQYPYNLADRSMSKTMETCVQTYGMSVITYDVLARGLFSGKHSIQHTFGRGDTRNKDGRFHGEQLTAYLRFVDRMRQTGKRYEKSPAQVAIRWVLQNESICASLVGMTNREQVTENVGAIGWALSADDHQDLSLHAGQLNTEALRHA